jgi:hypothetical protein
MREGGLNGQETKKRGDRDACVARIPFLFFFKGLKLLPIFFGLGRLGRVIGGWEIFFSVISRGAEGVVCRRMQARAAADAAPRARWARVGHRPRPPLLSGAHERFGWVPAVVTHR